MKITVVSAGDEKVFPLLKGLLLSLHRVQLTRKFEIVIMDLGLADDSLAWIHSHGHRTFKPEWSLDVDPARRKSHPHLRAFSERSHLPSYVPEGDLLIWLDADTWVQKDFALNWLIAAADGNRLAICWEEDRAYKKNDSHSWRAHYLEAGFGREALHLLESNHYYNSGVFALHREAPHWQPWAEAVKSSFDRSGGTQIEDQTALNFVLWTRNLAVHPLSALCNWTCHLGAPVWNSEKQSFIEPYVPYREIGIVHMTAQSQNDRFSIPGEKINCYHNPETY
jgi:lipopolysaccharide biosynthesis glycosyltransferase